MGGISTISNTERMHVYKNQDIFDLASPVVKLLVFIQNGGIYSVKH